MFGWLVITLKTRLIPGKKINHCFSCIRICFTLPFIYLFIVIFLLRNLFDIILFIYFFVYFVFILIQLFFSIRFYGPIPIALLRGRVFAKVVGSIPPIRYVPSDPDVILNANKIK